MLSRAPFLPLPALHDTSTRPRLALWSGSPVPAASLGALLPEWQLVRHARLQRAEAVLVWAGSPSAAAAERHAHRHALPLLRIEDGFLCAPPPPSGAGAAPLSILLDDLGDPADATRPSRLETLITTPCSPEQHDRGTRLLRAWVESRVSRRNTARDGLPESLLPSGALQPVLVFPPRPRSDPDGSVCRHLIEAALDEHPRAPVWLVFDPDTGPDQPAGHLAALSAGSAGRITLITGHVHLPSLFEVCRAVHVVDAPAGFEALLWRRPVRCFGMPFYAGWGLTRDELAAPARRRAAAPTLAAFAHATLALHPRHLDPETGHLTDPETLMAHLALQRRMHDRLPQHVQVLGFSRWKRSIAQVFLQGSTLTFPARPARVDPHRPLAVWGRQEVPPRSPGVATRTLRLEDGFIRSIGLGADLVQPVSWVVDDLGIYFDATIPSRLEHLLKHYPFDDALRTRAAALRQAIVTAGLTKYNVGQGAWRRPAAARRVVLVPGQVETDASIRWGAAELRTNLDLLAAARRAEPDAWLVYKPHPDVVAGLRHGGASAASGLPEGLCDDIVVDVPMHQLLDQVDAVHTLTSLTGFEALMRGKAVCTWGLPFYAGWGLTDDRAPADHPALQRRRQRPQPLQLDELVAATLILYPSYVSRQTGHYTTPERALQELRIWRDTQAEHSPSAPHRRGWDRCRRLALGWYARARGV